MEADRLPKSPPPQNPNEKRQESYLIPTRKQIDGGNPLANGEKDLSKVTRFGTLERGEEDETSYKYRSSFTKKGI